MARPLGRLCGLLAAAIPRQHITRGGCILARTGFYSSNSSQFHEQVPEQAPNQDDMSRDVTASRVVLNGKLCLTPKDAQTNLLDFLNQSDIQKRRSTIDIPFFTSGSYLSVMRSDPYSPTGVTKFVGICIALRKKGLGSTFILRNIFDGVGVEMMFELYSPALKEIKVLKLERRRRAKLFYLRDKPAKYSTVSETMKPVNSDGKVLKYRRRGRPA